MPRVDGFFLTEPPQYAVLRSHVANVPMITGMPFTYLPLRGVKRLLACLTGNCDDEGSLFSFASLNVSYVPIDALLELITALLTKVTDRSDTKGLETYLKSFMLPTATDAEIDLLLQYYPGDPQSGCPFDTGIRNILGTLYFFAPSPSSFEVSQARSLSESRPSREISSSMAHDAFS